jgi:hypothetical protein
VLDDAIIFPAADDQLLRLLPRRYQRPVHARQRFGCEKPSDLEEFLGGETVMSQRRQNRRERAGHTGPRTRRHAGNSRRDGATRRPRHAQKATEQPVPVRVPVVAAEDLITAIAGEGDGHVAPRQRTDEELRNLSGIGVRLVEDLGEAGDRVERVLARHEHFGVARSQMLSHARCVRRFVEVRCLERDRIGPYGVRCGLLHEGDHDRGIDAAGEERPQRNVCLHSKPDGFRESPLELRRRLGIGAGERLGDPAAGHLLHRPVRD